jgi:ribosomal protein S18 acetylase RimI-like enzyme
VLVVALQASFGFDLTPFGIDTPQIIDAVSVYASVYRQERQRSQQLVLEAATQKDFAGRLALVYGMAVGVAYGAATWIEHWWFDGIAAALGPDHPALHSAWNLMELAVLPSFRRRGIATALVDDLLAAQPYPRALLSVIVDNLLARTFYEHRDWRYLHSDLTFTATPNKRYAIMVRGLR